MPAGAGSCSPQVNWSERINGQVTGGAKPLTQYGQEKFRQQPKNPLSKSQYPLDSEHVSNAPIKENFPPISEQFFGNFDGSNL